MDVNKIKEFYGCQQIKEFYGCQQIKELYGCQQVKEFYALFLYIIILLVLTLEEQNIISWQYLQYF